MPSDIDIASNALLLIGDSPISSFDDEGAGAQVAKAIYSETYRAVLSEHPWSFAFKEQLLNLLSATPDQETGFTYAHQVPPDMIRLWALLPKTAYTIVGDKIYSNQTRLLARYVYECAETDLPPHVTKAIEYRLASEFALAITESATRAEWYTSKYQEAVALARSIDSQGRPQVPIVDSPFVDVRGFGNDYGGYLF